MEVNEKCFAVYIIFEMQVGDYSTRKSATINLSRSLVDTDKYFRMPLFVEIMMGYIFTAKLGESIDLYILGTGSATVSLNTLTETLILQSACQLNLVRLIYMVI